MNTLSNILVGSTLMVCGCSVMHFQNGTVEPQGRTVETWHHNVGLSLYELSPPMDMQSLCSGKEWSMVTTKETVPTALAGSVANGIWDPQIAAYTCGK